MPSETSFRKLSWKIVASIAIFVLANVVVYYSSGYFKQARDYHSVVQDFALRPRATMLILGDSHAAQLNNEYLDNSTYNAAFGGDGLRECYAKLRYLLDRHHGIKVVLLSADFHMFGRARQNSSNRAFVDRYLLVSGSPYGLDRGRLFALMNAVPLFNDEFVQYLKAAAADMLGSAGSADEVDVAWETRRESERSMLARRTGEEDHYGVGRYRESLEWYSRIKLLAETRDAKVILIRYPAHPEYLGTTTEEGRRSVDEGLADLGLMPILDFSAAFSDPAYFVDPDHVSPAGAAALIKRINDRIGSLKP